MKPPVFLAGRPIRGVLLDVDGTLYHQWPLRAIMALQLARMAARERSLFKAAQTVRVIQTFRRMREQLRDYDGSARLSEVQFEEPARAIGVTVEEVREVVQTWIYRQPLPYLGRCRRAGVETFLSAIIRAGVTVGVFSDYPGEEKLDALGLPKSISPVICSTDAEINRFKPDPRGFLKACEIWGLNPAEVVYVGDRHEVDATGARAAGMSCFILGTSRGLKEGVWGVSSWREALSLLSMPKEPATEQHRNNVHRGRK